MFPDGFVQDLKNRADIVDVVGRFVQLKKQGSVYVGICPFHQDHKPSMRVTPSMGIYKCFACGAGGDVFKFVQEHERVDFPEAVRMVAEFSGIPVPEARPSTPEESARERERDRLLEMHRLACDFFERELRKSEVAKEYLKKRGLTGQTAKDFSIGWAPEDGDALPRRLREAGYTDEEMLRGGLLKRNPERNSVYCTFRARVVFPFFSSNKSVIGFTGRTLDPENPAKYLNTPETPIYHKGNELFALGVTKEEIRKEQRAVVVEGNIDVVQLWQGGVRNVVAASGTAFTPQQARLLKRYAGKRVVLVFDGDAAGQKAARKAIPVLLAEGFEVRVLTLPEGEDPDDFVRKRGGGAFLAQVEKAQDFVDYLVGAARLTPDSSPEKRAELAHAVKEIVGAIPDPILRESYADKAGDALRIDPRNLAEAAGREPPRPMRPAAAGFAPPPAIERDLARALLSPAALELDRTVADSFDPALLSDPRVAEIVDTLFEQISRLGAVDLKEMAELLSDESRDALTAILCEGDADRSEAAVTATYLQTVLFLQLRRIDARLKAIAGDPARLELWLEGNGQKRALENLRREAGRPDADLVGLLARYGEELEAPVREFIVKSKK